MEFVNEMLNKLKGKQNEIVKESVEEIAKQNVKGIVQAANNLKNEENVVVEKDFPMWGVKEIGQAGKKSLENAEKVVESSKENVREIAKG